MYFIQLVKINEIDFSLFIFSSLRKLLSFDILSTFTSFPFQLKFLNNPGTFRSPEKSNKDS